MTEELRIIMETIGQLGQAGKEAFIWWLVMSYLFRYLTVGFFIAILGFISCRIIAAVKGHQQECRIVSEIAQKAGVRPSCYYDREQYNKMFEWTRKQ